MKNSTRPRRRTVVPVLLVALACTSACRGGPADDTTGDGSGSGSGGEPAPAAESALEPGPDTPIVPMVAAGEGTSFLLTSGGVVYSWGNQVNGRLGDGETGNRSRTRPALVSGLSQIRQIAVGLAHGLAVRQDGSVFAWGANGAGQLGSGEEGGEVGTPFRIPQLSGIISVAAGARFSMALDRDGRVHAWGENLAAQLGTGDMDVRTTPTLIAGLEDVALIAAGGQHALAVTRSGAIHVWGNNQDGQLGLGGLPDGDVENVLRPRRIATLDGLRVIAVDAGRFHSVLVLDDGSVRTFGASNVGQAGSDSVEDHFGFYRAPIAPAGVSGIAGVAAGDEHTLLLARDGSALALGHAGDGRLGDGSSGKSQSSSLPSSVNASDIVAIAAGSRHSLLLTRDGTVGCMGSNFLGQCGQSQGFTEMVNPTAVPGVGVGVGVR